MPIFDTPINTDDRNLERVIAQKKPVLILLHDGRIDKPLDDAASKAAKRYAGEVLLARVNVQESPATYEKYGRLLLPALVTITSDGAVKSQAEGVRPSDLRTHLDHLLNDTPLPTIGEQVKEKASPKPINVTDKTFDREVLNSDIPVFVDFWAAWCGPCRMIAPYVEQLAKEYQGRVKVVKLDTEHNQAIARRFQITSIPTFMTFKDGKQLSRMSGADPNGIRRMAEAALH